MRILFISPYIPSLIRVRPYNIIKYLAQRGHQITLLALVPPGEETGSLSTLKTWCEQVETVPLPRWRTLWNGVGALPQLATPLQAAYSRSPEMATLIRRTLAQQPFDAIHVEHMRGAELARAVGNRPVIFDSVDSITLLFEKVLAAGPTWRSRLMATVELSRNRRYEGSLLQRFSRVLVTSPQDKATLTALSAHPQADERIVVLPNGVDLDYFAPLNQPRLADTLVFSGKMSYHANVAAAIDLITRVMPLIWQQKPEIKLTIVGKDPSPKLLELAGDPRISVTGTVPDMRPYIGRAALTILPMRYGVGIQNKVLEAMAMATPVITTSKTLGALQVQANRELLVADTPQAMAASALQLLADAELRQRVGDAGRQYVETCHDWRKAVEKLEQLYTQVGRHP
ncbi:MAG: hypothetical protein FOGNACKC_01591 [Anaerolineae bacterium]|nr:hypothetical protein [Anaerolineae bacterium]